MITPPRRPSSAQNRGANPQIPQITQIKIQFRNLRDLRNLRMGPKPNAGGMRFLMEGVCLRFTESESRRTMDNGGI